MGSPLRMSKGVQYLDLSLSLECLTKGGPKWKVFKYGETELSVIKCKDDIWFRGKTLAEVLGYSNPLKAIRTHIDSEDKEEMLELLYKEGAKNGHPFRNVQRETIYVNESGLYSLVLLSKLESAKEFKQWVTSQVLPSIRKTGRYDYCIVISIIIP